MTDASAPAQVLIDRHTLHERVAGLGSELSAVFDGPEAPIAVSILKGSTLFLADLARSMTIDVEIEFMSITSYSEPGSHSGVVKIVKDLDSDISGRDILIVEDIVDTGLTLTYLRKTLGSRGPRSMRTVTLLDKAARRIIPVPLEYRGFEIDDVFVVGYGLDFQGRYRNVPEILAVHDVARLANEPRLLVTELFGQAG